MHKPDHFGEGFQRCKAMISCLCNVVAMLLQIIKESQNQVGADVIKCERLDLYMVIVRCERQKYFEGIPIGLDGMKTGAPDAGKVSVEKFMNYG